MSKLIIGKIPGYNRNINRNKLFASAQAAIDYTERLKNNLTTVVLKPTGYSINFGVIGNTLSEDQLKTLSTNFGKTTGLGSGAEAAPDLSKIYQIGNGALQQENTISTKGALYNWQQLVKTNTKLFTHKSFEVDELHLLATNDSTMTEVFGNSFDVSTSEKLLNNLGTGKVAETLQKVKKGVTIDSSYGLEMLQQGNNLSSNQLLNIVAGKALGIQTALPKEWFKSDYNNTLQLMIKLVSPSGDDESIQEFILKPLLFMVMAVSPITYDGINFGYPPLWEVQAEGLMDIQLAGISAMTITRGGNDTQFNRFNQPLNVDVRLTIEPLINGFATSMKDANYKDYLITNPAMLKSSMSIKDETGNIETPSYTTINL